MQPALVTSPNSALPLARKPVVDAEFKESEHPREEHGRFTSGGGSSSTGLESKSIRIKTSSNIKTHEDLKDFASQELPPDTDTHQFFYHAGRGLGDVTNIAAVGLKPGATGGKSWMSKDEIRDRGGGYVILRVPRGSVEEGIDYVDRPFQHGSHTKTNEQLGYREFMTYEVIPPKDIVKVVKAIPLGGGATIREDHLADYALKNQGLKGKEVQDLPQEYRGWFDIHSTAQDVLSRAAGLIILTPNGDALFLRYAPYHDHGGEWGFPAGGLEGDEEPEDAAIRETREETGWVPNETIKQLDTTQNEVDFATFATVTGNQFIPELSDEHDAWCWAPLSSPPEPLHLGVNKTLSELLAQDSGEDGIAHQAVASALTAALWHLANVWEPHLDKEIEHIVDTFQDRFAVTRGKARELLAPVIAKVRSMAKDAEAANVATKSELKNTIQFPPDKPKETRAINEAYAHGGTTGGAAKQSVEANKFINSGGITEKDRERTGRGLAVLDQKRFSTLRQKRRAIMDAEFKESEHPREEHGRFTSGGGGGPEKKYGGWGGKEKIDWEKGTIGLLDPSDTAVSVLNELNNLNLKDYNLPHGEVAKENPLPRVPLTALTPDQEERAKSGKGGSIREIDPSLLVSGQAWIKPLEVAKKTSINPADIPNNKLPTVVPDKNGKYRIVDGNHSGVLAVLMGHKLRVRDLSGAGEENKPKESLAKDRTVLDAEQKIKRDAFLYMEDPNEPNFAQCATCWLFNESSKRCQILPSDFEVSSEDSCGYYLEGKQELVSVPRTSPETVGFVKATKVRCENCEYGGDECQLYVRLNKAFPKSFDLDTKINPRGCCNAFQSSNHG